MLALKIVMAVAQAQLGHTFLGQGGCHMGQGIVQTQADHIRRCGARRNRQIQVSAGCLDAPHDQRGRVVKRAVPIKNDQVELARA